MKEFLGKELTTKAKKKAKKKNGKKMTKSGKPHKTTIRKYIMQDAEWKAKINEKKDAGEGDGNFIKCTSLVIEEMDDDVKEELQEKD